MMKFVVILSLFALAQASPSGKPKGDADGKIVGGTNANIADYPYTLGLLSLNRLFCGAVLISNNVALTAAHCVIPGEYVLSWLTVRGGSTAWASGGQSVGISRVQTHERYSKSAHDWDIAILSLASAFTTNNNVRPIGLAAASLNPAAGTYATVTGWGALGENAAGSANLQVVQVPLQAWANCRAVYGTTMTTNMWCAGYAAGGKDSCQGDSGGPAVINGVLAGLVSFGSGCARPGLPGVYASIPALRSWIATNAGI